MSPSIWFLPVLWFVLVVPRLYVKRILKKTFPFINYWFSCNLKFKHDKPVYRALPCPRVFKSNGVRLCPFNFRVKEFNWNELSISSANLSHDVVLSSMDHASIFTRRKRSPPGWVVFSLWAGSISTLLTRSGPFGVLVSTRTILLFFPLGSIFRYKCDILFLWRPKSSRKEGMMTTQISTPSVLI